MNVEMTAWLTTRGLQPAASSRRTVVWPGFVPLTCGGGETARQSRGVARSRSPRRVQARAPDGTAGRRARNSNTSATSDSAAAV